MSVGRSQRWHRLAVPLAALAVILVWAPVPVARHYADGPGGAEISPGAIDAGWEFVYHAVTASRGAELGTDAAALERATSIWAGPPALAKDVDLVYFGEGPVEIPVPAQAGRQAATRAVELGTRLGWAVVGEVPGGSRQVIGVLDYETGDVVADVRRLAGGRG